MMKTYEQTISDLFARKAEYDKKVRKRKNSVLTVVIGAVMIVSLSFGVYAYAADVRDYNEAAEYLDSIDYPTEGMTRSEIKSTYRKFKATVSYSNISADPVKIEEITGVDIRIISNSDESGAGSISYKLICDNEYRINGRYIQKYDGETLVWTYRDDSLSVTAYYPLPDGKVVVSGYIERTIRDVRGYFAELDENGRIIWQTVDDDVKEPSDSGFRFANSLGIFEEKGGTFLAIGMNAYSDGKKAEKYITLTRLSKDGEIAEKINTGISEDTVLHLCTRFGDGFIGRMSDTKDYMLEVSMYMALKKGNQKYVLIGPDGRISDAFEFSDPKIRYAVNDFREYEGKLYISADAVTHDTHFYDVGSWGRACFLSNPLSELVKNGGSDCTDILRDNCEAVLLVYDPGSDTYFTYYKESAALSGSIGIDENGDITWKTQSIESATAYYNSKKPESVNVIYSYTEYKYTFDKDGSYAVKTATAAQSGVKF